MVRMTEEHLYSTTRTFVWDRSVLYLFRGSIRWAKERGRASGLLRIYGPDVQGMPHLGLASVWKENTPHLFAGSLTDALGRGKGYKRRQQHETHERSNAQLYTQRLEAAGFHAQYGAGIGER